jgi:hypothetical protein
MPLYWILISHTILMMVFCGAHTVLSSRYNILLVVLLDGCRLDVDLELVLGLKSVDEFCHSSPMGIGGADTSQPPKGEICMDK